MEKTDIAHDVVKFYPSYIDADCKVFEGRKLKKELCIPGVNTKEIYDVLNEEQYNQENQFFSTTVCEQPSNCDEKKIESKIPDYFSYYQNLEQNESEQSP